MFTRFTLVSFDNKHSRIIEQFLLEDTSKTTKSNCQCVLFLYTLGLKTLSIYKFIYNSVSIQFVISIVNLFTLIIAHWYWQPTIQYLIQLSVMFP